jgi:hypothetical protein
MSIRQDIKIEIGLPWSLFLTIKQQNGTPLNLTNYSVHCKIKDSPDGSILFTPTITLPSAVNGTINLFIPVIQTNTITNELDAWYDLYLVDGDGIHSSLMQGRALIRKFHDFGNYDVVVTQANGWLNTVMLRNADGTLRNLVGYNVVAKIYRSKTDKTLVSNIDAIITSTQLYISLTSATTASLQPGAYVYEVSVDNGVEALKLLSGNFAVEIGVI